MKKFKRENKKNYAKLVLRVRAQDSQLKMHKTRAGTRFPFADHKRYTFGKLYAVIRILKNIKKPQSYVEGHTHPTDSIWMIEGNEPELSGFKIEVELDGYTFTVNSPASIYIPAGVKHTYRALSGSGKFINIVLTEGKNYNTITK